MRMSSKDNIVTSENARDNQVKVETLKRKEKRKYFVYAFINKF